MLIFLVAASVGQTQQTCTDLFNRERPINYGGFRAGFQHNNNYKVTVKDATPIKDQCGFATCTIQAWAGLLEQNYYAQNNKIIEISTRYLSLARWWSLTMERLMTDGPLSKTNFASNLFKSRDLILKFGLVPQSVLKPNVEFDAFGVSDRLVQQFENIVARYQTKIINEKDKDKQQKLFSEAEKIIEKMFEGLIGEFPEQFEFEGKLFTPKSFRETYFPQIAGTSTTISVDLDRKAKVVRVATDGGVDVLTAQIDVVEKKARELLDNGISFILGYDHQSSFADDRTGVLGIKIFDFVDSGRPLSRAERNAQGLGDEGHAVLVVGYDYDPVTNKVIKWKIKNSWGPNAGDGGYDHMYNDYFRAFSTSITFFTNPYVSAPSAVPLTVVDPQAVAKPELTGP
ncbi:MAG: hypothetical protein H7061_01165 [Bdellovibrionaceae bacterium]|nr:hypothetical protein [Bdellovibrio sp.]